MCVLQQGEDEITFYFINVCVFMFLSVCLPSLSLYYSGFKTKNKSIMYGLTD